VTGTDLDHTGEFDWSIVDPRSRSTTTSCWTRRSTEAAEEVDERLEQFQIDEHRVLTVHRQRARGRASGVKLERTDAQLWTFREGRLARAVGGKRVRPDRQRRAGRLQRCGGLRCGPGCNGG
jgi:ketosteroid isomerase-like protein